ncbi:TPA: hypothetical protein KRU84_000811 [Escherichia coli]|nr:hypothetical protein [Escherichia coli]HBG9462462.1 hypothetical protein [Escherichia coli]
MSSDADAHKVGLIPVTLMVITAMYALNYNRLHKNPYPLDAPISKD